MCNICALTLAKAALCRALRPSQAKEALAGTQPAGKAKGASGGEDDGRKLGLGL